MQFKSNSMGAFCLSVDVDLSVTASSFIITPIDGTCVEPTFVGACKGYGLPEVFELHRVRSTIKRMKVFIFSTLAGSFQ